MLFQGRVYVCEVLHITGETIKLIHNQSIHDPVRDICEQSLQTWAVRIGSGETFILIAFEGLHIIRELEIYKLPTHPLLIVYRVGFI